MGSYVRAVKAACFIKNFKDDLLPKLAVKPGMTLRVDDVFLSDDINGDVHAYAVCRDEDGTEHQVRLQADNLYCPEYDNEDEVRSRMGIYGIRESVFRKQWEQMQHDYESGYTGNPHEQPGHDD